MVWRAVAVVEEPVRWISLGVGVEGYVLCIPATRRRIDSSRSSASVSLSPVFGS